MADQTNLAKMTFGGNMAETIGGVGAVALAILGLANILPTVLLTITTILVGVSLAFEGGAVASRYAMLVRRTNAETNHVIQYGGITSEFLAGAVGIALGILALLDVVPMVLVPIAAIVYGAGLIMDSGVQARLSELEAESTEQSDVSRLAVSENAKSSAGIQVLVGVAVIALGVLSLIGIQPMVLSLVAMLSIGVAVLLTGSMIGSRMLGIIR